MFVSVVPIREPKISWIFEKKIFPQNWSYILCKFSYFHGLYMTMHQCGDLGNGAGTRSSVQATSNVKIRPNGDDVKFGAKRPNKSGGEMTKFSLRLFS